jgi:hypothetical protein
MNYYLTLQEHLKNLSFHCFGANEENLLHMLHIVSYHYYHVTIKYLLYNMMSHDI